MTFSAIKTSQVFVLLFILENTQRVFKSAQFGLVQEYEPNSPQKGELGYDMVKYSDKSSNTPNSRSGATGHGDSSQVTKQ